MTDPINSTGLAPIPLYPTDLGNFAALPDELIARIFANIQQLTPGGSTPCVCRDFQQVFQDPVTAYLYLESELEEKTTLTFAEIESYRAGFRQKYHRELPLSLLASKCPRLTTLDLS